MAPRRTIVTLRACAAALLLILPVPAAGQPAPSGVGPEVSVTAGVLAPLAELTRNPGSFSTEVSSAVGVSASLGYWLGSGLGVAANGVWAPAELNVQQSAFTGPIPNDLGEADFLAGTLTLMYRIRSGGAASIVEPFFGLGAGVRHLSVDPIAAPEVENATDPAATVVAGAVTRLGSGLALRLEVRDLVSRYASPLDGESRVQNDVVVGVGLSFRP